MKCKIFVIILFMGVYAVFSQDSSVDTTAEGGEVEEITEESVRPEEATSEEFQNPFATEEGPGVTGQETAAGYETEASANPFLAQDEGGSQEEESEDEFEQEGIDIILDLGVGVSLSSFTVEPDYIATKMKPDFLFQPGVLIPFARWFYGSIAVRYLRISLKMSNEWSSFSPNESITIKETTDELLSFISVPCKIGMRFDLGLFTPYFYGDIEPAYLTAAGQFITSEKEIVYANGLKKTVPETEDRNTTDYRERFQVFIGGGIGLDISYGYGSVYIDGGINLALLDTDNGDGIEISRPYRTAIDFIYFPVTIGIRFYL